MEEMMKVLQIVEPGRAEWTDTPLPELEPGEVLIKVAAITTCPHWDLHIMSGEPMFPGVPLEYPYTPGQPGHEMTGEVVAIGPDVTGLSVGARVAAWRDPGKVRQGCYAQYVPFQAENLLEIPPNLAFKDIASLELSMCVQVAYDQLNAADAIRDKRVGVSGLGSAGLIAVQMARCYGAREVVAIDPLPERRDLAAELGADVLLSPDGQELSGGVAGADALDAAIDCTGLKGSIEFLLENTKQAVLVFGVLRDEVAFGFKQWRSGVNLMGYGFHNRAAAEQARQLVLDGKLHLAPLATHELPLRNYADGVELLRTKQAIKVRFLPWE